MRRQVRFVDAVEGRDAAACRDGCPSDGPRALGDEASNARAPSPNVLPACVPLAYLPYVQPQKSTSLLMSKDTSPRLS
jgi:hypothetical protein